VEGVGVAESAVPVEPEYFGQIGPGECGAVG
jgi:hypothetical protein